MTRFNALLIAALVATISGAATSANPLTALPRPPRQADPLLPAGTTKALFTNRPSTFGRQPDPSTQAFWVRLFPLISVPPSDPYPQTSDQNHVEFQNAGGLEIFSMTNGQRLGSTTLVQADFKLGRLLFNKSSIGLTEVYLESIAGTPIQVRWDIGGKSPTGDSLEVGVRMRGTIVLQKTVFSQDDRGRPTAIDPLLWSVINVLPVEEYIQSVVATEVLPSWSATTLRAQAIAARSYGLFEMASARLIGRNWDVDPSTWFQSYRGVEFWNRKTGAWSGVEQPSTTKATLDTNGQTLLYNGEVIKSYFSANSGGQTCTVQECFGFPDVPYITSVSDAPGIEQAAGGTWGSTADLSPSSILSVLTQLGIAPTQPVIGLQPLTKGPSGRTWQLRVSLNPGFIDLDPAQTRKMMRLFGTVRSFLYQLGGFKNGKQEVIGHGFGHGVGMSQWGAELFARMGWSTDQILQHYYPGAQVSRLAEWRDPR